MGRKQDQLIRTKGAFAKALGVGLTTLREWLRRDDLPDKFSVTGPWTPADVERLLAWRAAALGHGPGSADADDTTLSSLPSDVRGEILKTAAKIKAGKPWAYPAVLAELPAKAQVEVCQRLEKLEADVLANQVAAGAYVKREDIDHLWEQQAHAVKARLGRIPRELAGILAGQTDPIRIETTLDDAIRAACNELADQTAAESNRGV